MSLGRFVLEVQGISSLCSVTFWRVSFLPRNGDAFLLGLKVPVPWEANEQQV